MARCGVAGLDKSGQRAMVGVAGEIKTAWHPAFGIAGLDHQGKFGVAGINCKSVAKAAIAGNLNAEQRSTLVPHVGKGKRLGDRAVDVIWQHGVYFADYTYVVCTDDRGKGEKLRWRRGRDKFFGLGARQLPLFFDSAAFRKWTGKAPSWTSFDTYLQAIELCKPDGYCAYDVIGDQAQSVTYYKAMVGMGYHPFPVYHVRPRWNDGLSVVSNARAAVADPTMRYYADRSSLIGLGGMVKGPVPRGDRHIYIKVLADEYPDHQFWALGQANFKVINGLGRLGLLDRVWTDGTWWILDAACERFAVVKGGQLQMLSLGTRNESTTYSSFFTTTEMMAANLRSLLSAYAGLWTWPPPEPMPLELGDQGQCIELKGRLVANQLDLFGENMRMVGNIPVRIE